MMNWITNLKNITGHNNKNVYLVFLTNSEDNLSQTVKFSEDYKYLFYRLSWH